MTQVSAQCIISKSNVKTVFRATECLSLFSLKQCTLKKNLDWFFVISGVIKVEVHESVIEAEEIMLIIR